MIFKWFSVSCCVGSDFSTKDSTHVICWCKDNSARLPLKTNHQPRNLSQQTFSMSNHKILVLRPRLRRKWSECPSCVRVLRTTAHAGFCLEEVCCIDLWLPKAWSRCPNFVALAPTLGLCTPQIWPHETTQDAGIEVIYDRIMCVWSLRVLANVYATVSKTCIPKTVREVA